MAALRVRLHTSAYGNLFMTEIAQLLGAALHDLGCDVEMRSDELPTADIGYTNIVVAPHEFFPLFPAASEARCLEAAARSVLVSVEQPGTTWFGIGSAYSQVAASVLDINALAVAELCAGGIDAHWLRLGYHPSWDRRAATSDAQRHYDVVYLGSLTARREALLGELAPTLAGYDTRLVIHDGLVPVTATAANFLSGDAKHDLLAASRILLNIHRSDLPYFEWHRHLAALANGCLVLTEPSDGYEPLVPWEHFAVAPRECLADTLTMLLSAPELRERITDQAASFVRDEFAMVDLLRPLLPVLADAAVQTPTLPAERARRLRRTPGAHDDRVRRGGRVEPSTPQPPVSEPVERALKRALVAQSKLARRVERLAHRIETGAEQHIDTVDSKAFADAVSDVSVIVPLHNYEQFVEQALVSALRSRDIRLEVIVVDDHSTDSSRLVVEKVIAAHPDAAIRLLALAVNVGVSAARNLAIDQARAPLVFFLDADNSIYPNTLRKLHDALDRDPSAAFAYGALAAFGASTHLVSAYPWDVQRLVRGNYIDVMAMVRKSVLDEVGGFSLDLDGLGWEDFDLWLRLAARGHHAVFAAEIVGAYRFHEEQRTGIVNLDVAHLFDVLRARYPTLPWPVRDTSLPSDLLDDPHDDPRQP